MEVQLEQIREQQKESWNKFSPGWKKWDSLKMDFLKPMGDEIIRQLKLKDDDMVLDVAAGTGEPGLTIATIVRNGKVISTDLAEGMLAIARENAQKRGITNFETVQSDVSELPFDYNTFDAVSCRFGFMFFPDMQLAANEMYRVLRPGGRMAVSVWGGPRNNFWITAIMGAINKYMQLPPPPPGAPGLFRCANSKLMTQIFVQAGFTDIAVVKVNGKLNCGTADTYWQLMTEIAAPIVTPLSKADDTTIELIRNKVIKTIHQRYPSDRVYIDASAIVISGKK